MTDWLPRKVLADAAYLSKAPKLLRAFIRFCHDREGIRSPLTQETLAGIDRWEPEYQRVIRSSRPQGPAALAALLLDGDELDEFDEFDPDEPFGQFMLRRLDTAVGGRTVLMNLAVDPLPDEPFEWAAAAVVHRGRR